MRRALLITGLVASWIVCFACGIGFGLLRGQGEAYGRQYKEERDLIDPVLASDPAFARVTIHPLSSGGLSLGGTVKSVADLDRLRAAVVRQVGEPRAKWMVDGVEIEKQPGGRR